MTVTTAVEAGEVFGLLGASGSASMGIGQVLTMPLFFASNAIYPLDIMPRWLRIVAHADPLTYEVDALRASMLVGGASVYGLAVDFGVLAAALTVLIIVVARVYPRVVN